MTSLIVGMIKLMERHTGLYLNGKMLDFCTDWNIDPLRVTASVTDNAENIKLAVKLAFGSNKILPCIDHTLNLIPRAALGLGDSPGVPGVRELVGKVKAVVTLSHCSQNFSNELKKIRMEQFGKTEGTTLRLLQDVGTRWWSTFVTLERWFELRAVTVLAASKFPEVDMPTAAEHQTLETTMGILRHFHDATKVMGAEKFTTLSKCIPIHHLLPKEDQSTPVIPGSVAAQFRDFVAAELQRRFGNIESHRVLAAATLLDPRFMKNYFHSPLAAAEAVTFVEEQAKQELLLRLTDGQAPEPAAGNDNNVPAPAGNASTGLWAAHAALVASTMEHNDGADILLRAHTEVRGYLGRDIMGIDKDPLRVWEDMKTLYPGLYAVARRYLTIVATSVSMERGFSIAGDIVDDKGNRLSSIRLAHRLFLKTVENRKKRRQNIHLTITQVII
ncbi:hypothetical protein ONE63_001650 [Megalurothrips usitatus]|uniref:HAT C-terminal dimerisation domain-containing protein n=1 Tax=Megalurothrips usitatus TaxID=439358 RepID=A0AAV7XCP0_9NEOP|nr:hypothetical protein ONE63_001650 [Megalurothrips usitatus]